MPLRHSRTREWLGSLARAGVASASTPSTAALSASAPVGIAQRFVTVRCDRVVIFVSVVLVDPSWWSTRWCGWSPLRGIFQSENETTGSPRLRGWGPVSLWLPASSSDQCGACGSMPPRWCWCCVLWLSALRAPRCVPDPDCVQWLDITTESGGSQATQSELCRASHILERMQPLIDPFGRRVTDLRISITDRCNFRCTYCMPAEGMQWLPRDELLTYEEQAQIVRVCVERYGFESVRITGGEPTLAGAPSAPRGDARTARDRHRHDHQRREAAGDGPRPRPGRALKRINVSLDSLRARRVPVAHPPRRPAPGARRDRRRRSTPASTR